MRYNNNTNKLPDIDPNNIRISDVSDIIPKNSLIVKTLKENLHSFNEISDKHNQNELLYPSGYL